MKMTILNELIRVIKEEFKRLPDSRGKKHRTYTIEDIAMSAYAMFYFQNPSWMDYQRNMKNRTGRSNAKSLFVSFLDKKITIFYLKKQNLNLGINFYDNIMRMNNAG